MFNASDLNKNGKLGFNGFVALCDGLEKIVIEHCGEACTLTNAQKETRFKAFDLGGKGYVTL